MELVLGLAIGIIITAVFYNVKYNRLNSTLTDKILINSLLKKELGKKPFRKYKKTRRGNGKITKK